MTPTRQLPDQTNLMEELAQRCERASGPDRELDALIGIGLGWFVARPERWEGDGLQYVDVREAGKQAWPGHGGDQLVPNFTGSLDVALALAPNCWSWRVGNLPSGRGFASLGTQTSLEDVEAATPALALCAASLRARKGLA